MHNHFQRAAGAAGLLLLTGCGSSHVESKGAAVPTGATRPERIIVQDFVVQPSVVSLDSGIGARVLRAVGSGNSETEQRETAAKVVRKLSETLVKDLNPSGIPTSPGSTAGIPAPNYSTLVVSGKILSIDEGNRTRRNVVGFGVGASKVTAEVDLYLNAPGAAPRLLQAFTADAESGKKPGLAVAGVGAAAGHVATAAAVGVGSTVAGESLGATPEDNAGRMGKEIASALNTYFVNQGWVQPKR